MNSMIASINRFGAQRGLTISRIGTTVSPRANCPLPNRSARKASSATSSSRSGLGADQSLSARPDRDRPAQSKRERQWQALWLAGISTDYIPILDPVTHKTSEAKITARDPKTPSSKDDPMAPSAYYGDERSGQPDQFTQSNDGPIGPNPVHVAESGRQQNPAFCQEGSSHPSAKAFPTRTSTRHAAVYDPSPINSRSSTPALARITALRRGRQQYLWFQRWPGRVGWNQYKLLDETGDDQKSQAGRLRGRHQCARQARALYRTEPAGRSHQDHRLNVGTYGIGVTPDGAVWTTVRVFPGFIMRTVPGPIRPTRR